MTHKLYHQHPVLPIVEIDIDLPGLGFCRVHLYLDIAGVALTVTIFSFIDFLRYFISCLT